MTLELVVSKYCLDGCECTVQVSVKEKIVRLILNFKFLKVFCLVKFIEHKVPNQKVWRLQCLNMQSVNVFSLVVFKENNKTDYRKIKYEDCGDQTSHL